ncbi:oligogalacturonide transport system substrate-binding protein [Natranaerovirga pectinivora]|uniref:Oligogalacturonide transport system substrate-binding protein n=1 Tax=Natranaerovirga pectinivora TaxID=682400 RepID=A0A4R3MLU3_9FIRM|nr:ABC transporter substrate-binding protein [Natranaerovirga pectinivora]TCT13841.1 oligogalacturonide transport system substrate-binding protein [Natranaerovirga pectinivora]
MKKLLALLVVLALTLSIVGCGQKDETPDPAPAPAPGEPAPGPVEIDEDIEIRFSWWGGDSRHEATQAVIDLFMEANPNITVVPEFTAWTGHFERIAAQLTARDEADLMQINFNWFYGFSPEGDGFYDLRQLGNIDLNNWPAETLAPITINGKVQGVPTSIGARLYYVNHTPFEQAGIEVPTTWDGLMEAGRVFKEKLGPDYYPLGNIGYTDALQLMMWSYLAQLTGKDIFDGNQLAYTEEELITAFEFVQELVDNNVIPGFHDDSAEKNHENPNWIDGRYAAVFQWNSGIQRDVNNLNPAINPDVRPVPWFTMDGAKHTGVFSKILMAFSVSVNSEHPEAAAKLLNFMYTDKDAVLAHGLERAIPLNRVALDILDEAGMLEGLAWEGHLMVSETDGYTFHPFFEDTTVRKVPNDAIEEFLFAEGGITPQQAARMILDTFDRTVAEAMEN